jgi:hypothetical protein
MYATSSRIAFRIPVARVIHASTNYPAYMNSVARACQVLDLDVTIAHGDYKPSGAFHGTVELRQFDLRWNNDVWNPGWALTTPRGVILDRPFGRDLYPLPLDVALKAQEEAAEKERRDKVPRNLHQDVATALQKHPDRRYNSTPEEELPRCGTCKLDVDINTFECGCDGVAFGMQVMTSTTTCVPTTENGQA